MKTQAQDANKRFQLGMGSEQGLSMQKPLMNLAPNLIMQDKNQQLLAGTQQMGSQKHILDRLSLDFCTPQNQLPDINQIMR